MLKHTLHFSKETTLNVQRHQLRIERKGAPVTTFPIEDIGIIVLEHPQISITHYALSALLAEGAAVITCNEKYMPVGMLLPLEGHTLQQERFEAQMNASQPLRKQLWQQTVQAKIQNQANLLVKYGIGADPLYKWATEVKSGDTTNREARAAVTYWHNLFRDTLDAEYLPFTRDQFGAPPNNLLNYGYAILRATTARALVAAGLLPTLGIHHANRYNAYCLADDVMEPYRPFVDRLVMEMLDSDMGLPEILTTEHKQLLLRVPTLDVRMSDEDSPLAIAMQRTAASLAKCFLGESRKILYPEMPWFSSTNDLTPTDVCG